jgi:hypothetical protein
MSKHTDEGSRIQWWRSVRKKVHYALAIVLVAGGVLWVTHEYLVTAALSTYARIDMHPQQATALAHELQQRQLDASAATSSQFLLDDYQFAVPVPMSIERQIGNKRIVLRGSGLSATVGLDTGDRLAVAEEIDRQSMPVDEIFPYDTLTQEQFFGDIASVSPEQLSLLSPAREMARETILLALKASLVPNTISGASAFHGASISGYQFGNPAQDKHVVIHAFASDGGHFSIGVDGFTQQQIDALLASIGARGTSTAQ